MIQNNATMYSIHSATNNRSATPQAAPIIIIQERRSVCARITAFLMMLLTGFYLISLMLSVGVYMAASEETLRDFMRTLNNGQVDISPGTQKDDRLLTSDFVHISPAPTGPVEYTAFGLVEAIRSRFTLRLLGGIVAATVLAGLMISSYYAYQMFTDMDAVTAQLLPVKETVYGYVSQLFTEVSEGVLRVVGQILSFDYVSLWNDIVAFAQSVWSEIKLYFVDNMPSFGDSAASDASVVSDSYVVGEGPVADGAYVTSAGFDGDV